MLKRVATKKMIAAVVVMKMKGLFLKLDQREQLEASPILK